MYSMAAAASECTFLYIFKQLWTVKVCNYKLWCTFIISCHFSGGEFYFVYLSTYVYMVTHC